MIICAGEILIDRFIDGEKHIDKPGGAPFNVACGMAKVGRKVGFFGSVGDDEEGESLLGFAAGFGFDPLSIKTIDGKKTTIAEVSLVNGERSFRFDREDMTDALLDFEEFKALLASKPNIVHFGSLMVCYDFGREFLRLAASECQKRGITTSFDVNYRDDIFASREEAIAIYRALVPLFDIVKMSDEEQAILYPSGYETRPGQLLVLSCGKSGSKAYLERKEYSAPSTPLKPVDTTGAGDAFYSFFLSEVDACGDISKLDVDKALHYANAAGAIATQRVGAISSLPTLDEVKAFADEKRLVL